MTRSTMTIATKRIGDKWHGAVIANDNFMQSLIEDSLEVLVQKALVGVLIDDRPEGAAVNINIVTVPPEAASGSGETQK